MILKIKHLTFLIVCEKLPQGQFWQIESFAYIHREKLLWQLKIVSKKQYILKLLGLIIDNKLNFTEHVSK